ncbi:hypothetical protein RchiOBHm_Chr5g0029201 [Rosa chinensis]|uniref:Uncharacterized protein n=1 Tax=Rosa chinensis TaxID=74649 RepID=A0A2P6Q9K6_ROSCH|nr:hypothetical protein RchiOBHm_Chr5g0029201 [Rosa chinensis]
MERELRHKSQKKQSSRQTQIEKEREREREREEKSQSDRPRSQSPLRLLVFFGSLYSRLVFFASRTDPDRDREKTNIRRSRQTQIERERENKNRRRSRPRSRERRKILESQPLRLLVGRRPRPNLLRLLLGVPLLLVWSCSFVWSSAASSDLFCSKIRKCCNSLSRPEIGLDFHFLISSSSCHQSSPNFFHWLRMVLAHLYVVTFHSGAACSGGGKLEPI